VLFGSAYPHFLSGRPLWTYLYAAPLALIPCPTLAFVCGLRLLGIAYAGRLWTMLLACAALFYALFGVLRLGVTLDLFLLAGCVGLFVQQWRERAWARLLPSPR
jgi:hypothetical protein